MTLSLSMFNDNKSIEKIVSCLNCIALYCMYHLLLGPTAISGSFYGKPNKAIHYDSVNCDGSEQGLTNCLYVQYTLEHGKELNIHVEVAGVNCKDNHMIISDSLTTSTSKHLTTGKLQYVSSMMTSTTIATGGAGVSDTNISGSEVAILSIGIVALILGATALIIG